MASRDEIKYRKEEENSTKQRATLLGVGYFDTREIVQQLELIRDIIPLEDMKSGQIIPLRRGNDRQSYVFAITSESPRSMLDSLRAKYADKMIKVDYVLISKSGYKDIMLRYDPPVPIHYEDVIIAKDGDSETLEQVSSILEGVRSDDILTYLIDQADKLHASDIHIENYQEFVRIRYRVNGVLHPIAKLSREKYRVLLASIASRSNLSTASTDAQAGHLSQRGSENPDHIINMRIETVPTTYGQDVVIRLFQFDESRLTIGHLGLDDNRRKVIEEVVSHPHGMLMMVGPTGSGKSSTLYSIINALNSSSIKILSL
ncbi:MAG: ATPase, T2SS/T4P/T4SS family, partial [Candidatus Saccharimonadales bacterium]